MTLPPIPDVDLIEGVTVEVLRPSETIDTDSMGDPVKGSPTSEYIDGVLFDPTASSDLSGTLRMNSIEVDADFLIPKSYTKSLRGCSIAYDGHTYLVISDARRYTGTNVPGNRNGVVSTKEVS